MAWTITDRFPLWGEDGELPPDGFFYEGGDQVNEKHLDALWNGIKELENEARSSLEEIDSDKDGVVDETSSVTSGGTLNGDLFASDETTIVWDSSNKYVPQGRLENDSVTINTQDGLIGGGSVSLGGSIDISSSSPPSGVIAMWSGSIANIPDGWTLCDGTDGAPNLQDRFVVGAGSQYTVGETGGEEEHQLTVDEMPSHNHNANSTSSTNNFDVSGGDVLGVGGSDDVGGDQPHENRPPYYSLAYIMKL